MIKERGVNIVWGFGGMCIGVLLSFLIMAVVLMWTEGETDNQQTDLLTNEQIKAIAESLSRIENAVRKK